MAENRTLISDEAVRAGDPVVSAVGHAAEATAGATASQDKRAERLVVRRAFQRDAALRTGFVLLLLVVWQVAHYVLVTRTEIWSGALFPSPLEVGKWLWVESGLIYFTDKSPLPGRSAPTSFLNALQQAHFPPAIVVSVVRLIEGYGIALLLGVPLGLIVARWTIAEKTIGWMATSLQALPSICWIPLALLWFGRSGDSPPVLFVTATGALFAVIIAVADGVRNVPPLMGRAGQTLGASGLRLYFAVLLPAALPAITTGLKIGWSFAWRALMAAELLVGASENNKGLGFYLESYRNLGAMDGVLATILVIMVIGLVVQTLVFAPIERRLQSLWGFNTA